MAERSKYRLIDLFSGAGGMTEGFVHLAKGFEPVWANDFDAACVQTYNRNFGDHCVHGDLVELIAQPDSVPPADIVIGGPPCQGFSLLNKQRAGDARKHLWLPYMEVVERSGAEMFVMENVPQLLGTAECARIEKRAEQLGFHIARAILHAVDYGVPQSRRRAFIVGCRFADPAEYFPPEPTHNAPNAGTNGNGRQRRRQTVRDAIGDLPPPRGTAVRPDPPPLDLHFGRTPTALSMKRYATIPDEGMNRFDLQRRAPEITPACWHRKTKGGTDLFGRLWWDRPAFTIRTEFFKPEKGRYLHPEQHRPITHREAARLQSFPDSFIFCGTKTQIARQIGNAVPPLLAAAVARTVLHLFRQKNAGHSLSSTL